MCPEVRASLSVVFSLFCSFLWLWIVGGVGDVEACVMSSVRRVIPFRDRFGRF